MSNLDHLRIREKKKAKKGEKQCETYALVQSNSINMDTEGAIEIKCPYYQGVCIKWVKFREKVRAFFPQGQSKTDRNKVSVKRGVTV